MMKCICIPNKSNRLRKLLNFNYSIKRLSLSLIAIILCLNLTGCSFNIPSLSEAKEVAEAFIHYSRTGELPENIYEIIAEKYPEEPDIDIEDFIVETGIKDALTLARKYYELSYPLIESDLRGEFNQIVTWEPEFDGNSVDPELCNSNSMNVAFMVTYTDAKNFYMALACSVFSLNPQDANAASNLATAIATYCDQLQYENTNISISKKSELYEDSISMHYYALAAATRNNMPDMKDTILVNLGNLLLDTKRFEEAYATFKAALDINTKNWPAVTGLYNYYMAVRQFDRALKLVADNTEAYPVFVRSISDIEKRTPEEPKEQEKLDGSKDEAFDDSDAAEVALEKRMEELKHVPAVTSADFVMLLDSEAADKIKKDMEQLQIKMQFKCPNIDSLLVLTSYEKMNSIPAQGAYSTAVQMSYELSAKMLPETAMSGVKKQIEILDSLGIDLELGFDVDNLDEIIKDAMKNPEKYENYDPGVKVSGTKNAEKKAKDILSGLKKGISESSTGDPRGIYEELAKTRPEYKVMLINPFAHTNSNDVIIQQKNIQLLSSKLNTYDRYMQKVTAKPHEMIVDLNTQCYKEAEVLSKEYNKKMDDIKEAHEKEIDDLQEKLSKTKSLAEEDALFNRIEDLKDQHLLDIHLMHETYYPRFNALVGRYWKKTTGIATTAYKKIEKYAPQMYNDCMKHIMLISDEKVRDTLEGELISKLTGYIKMGLGNAVNGYQASPLDIDECGCDKKDLAAIKERREKESEKLANEAIKKAKQDRKNFLAGVLDENSKYYKEFIKKYEVDCNFGFVKGKISPYKSSFSVGVEAFNVDIKFRSETQHLQNTTTLDGGIKLGTKIGGSQKDPVTGEGINMPGVSIKGGFGFSAKIGSDGNFSPDDFDIRASIEAGMDVGMVNIKGGVEVSALRGTREYAELAFTASPFLDKLKKDQQIKDMISGLPSIKKKFWEGEYSEQP